MELEKVAPVPQTQRSPVPALQPVLVSLRHRGADGDVRPAPVAHPQEGGGHLHLHHPGHQPCRLRVGQRSLPAGFHSALEEEEGGRGRGRERRRPCAGLPVYSLGDG